MEEKPLFPVVGKGRSTGPGARRMCRSPGGRRRPCPGLRKEGVLGGRRSWGGAAAVPMVARGEELSVPVSPGEVQPRSWCYPKRGSPQVPGSPGRRSPWSQGQSPPFSPRSGARGAPLGSAVRRSLPCGDDGWMALAWSEEADRRGRYRGAT